MSTYIQTTEKTIYKSGTRGKILDKSGKVLAYDALSYAVTIEDKIAKITLPAAFIDGLKEG